MRPFCCDLWKYSQSRLLWSLGDQRKLITLFER
jgi:hypothetical protein